MSNNDCKRTINQPLEKIEHEEDYIFRFPLEVQTQPLDTDTMLVNFYKDQIQDLLKIIFFNKNGEKIIPTEFGFLNDPEKTYPIITKITPSTMTR